VGGPDKPEVTRLGWVTVLPGRLHSILGARARYIAQLELLTVLVAATEVAGIIHGASSTIHRQCGSSYNIGRRIKWFPLAGQDSQDNTLSVFCHPFSTLLEYIESGANWVDEISREGAQGN